MIYRRLKRFRKAFAVLPPDLQAATFKAFRLFQTNPLTFEYSTDSNTGERTCIFRNIGPHDILDRNP